jgi:hypothetical protein
MLRDYEHERGAFCAVEPKAGVYFNKVSRRRDGLEFSILLTEW